MPKSQPMTSREEILKSLEERATALWGQERAQEIRSTIEQTAGHIWQLSQDLPDLEEEPGFYF
jgi:hypothetical protein